VFWGVSSCVNGGLVSVETRFAFSFSPKLDTAVVCCVCNILVKYKTLGGATQ
jgi:hypothetical protein